MTTNGSKVDLRDNTVHSVVWFPMHRMIYL